MANHYQTLGLNPDGKNAHGVVYTQDNIKKAYRKRALQYHPDKNKDGDAAANLHKIQEAYKCLSDPSKRAEYDATLEANSKHLFVVLDNVEIDLTQSIANAKIPIEAILNAAKKNPTLAREIWLNEPTLNLLPLIKQYELLFIACSHINTPDTQEAQRQASELAGGDIASLADTFAHPRAANYAAAICTACLQHRDYFDIAQKYFVPILEKLPNEHLLRLCSVYSEAARFLFQNHRVTPLRLSEFLFILKHHPRERQKLVEQAPDYLQQQFGCFQTLQRSIDWNNTDLTPEDLLPYQEQFQAVGSLALSLSTDKPTKIKILKLLIGEDPTIFWNTVEPSEQQELQALIVFDFCSSYKKATKDNYFDDNLMLSHNGNAILFDKLPLRTVLALFAELFQLDRCNPTNVPGYVKHILSFSVNDVEEASSEPVLKLTNGSLQEPAFLRLLKENDVCAFACLEKGRELFLATIALSAYNANAFQHRRARQRLAYLYFHHGVEPVPEILKPHYDAIKELHKYITKNINAEAPKDDINNDNNAPQPTPFIEDAEFFRLFELSGFFYDLLLIKTTSLNIKLCLIEHFLSETNEKSEKMGGSFTAFQNDDNITKLIASVLAEGTDEHVDRIVRLLSGKNARFISSYLNSIIHYDLPTAAESEFFIKMLILNRLRACDPAFADQIISSAALLKLTFNYNEDFLFVLFINLVDDIHPTDLMSAFGGPVNTLRVMNALKKSLESLKDKLRVVHPPENEGEKKEEKAEKDEKEEKYDYEALIIDLVKRTQRFLKKHTELQFKASFAWHTVITSEWRKNKINAYSELAKMGEYLKTHPADDNALSQFIEILKRTHIDRKTLELIAIMLKFTRNPLWQALLYLMHHTKEFVIFEDAREALQEPAYALENPNYQLESQFFRFAELTLRAEEGKTSPEAVAILIYAHGEKILPLLEEMRLITQHQRHQDLSGTFDAISNKQCEFKVQPVNSDAIIQALLERFKTLVKTCPDKFLCKNVPAETLFEDMVSTIREYDITSPELTLLCEAYPAEDKKNLLLWVVQAARRDDKFAQSTLREWKNRKETLNALLDNQTTFAWMVDEFIESVNDLVNLKTNLTLSNRNKIAAYLLQKYGTQHPLIQQFLADIRNPEKKLSAGDIFSPDVFSVLLCEAYTKKNDLVKAEFYLTAARSGNPEVVLPEAVKELSQWMTLPDEYQHVRTTFTKRLANAQTDEERARLAAEYKTYYETFVQTHQRLSQQQKAIDQTIAKLSEHVTVLMTKRAQCKGQFHHDVEKAEKYTRRIAAIKNLATDLKTLSKNYYGQDFSELESNNSEFHNQLSLEINKHLNKENSVLKEQTGSKQVVYDLLAALTWILLPFSIYKAVTHKTLFYFHAENTTEELLSKEIKPQIRTTLVG